MSITLEQMIDRVRKLATLPADAVHDVAGALTDETKRSIASGQSPSGAKWAPRKSDGGQTLRNAAANLSYAGIGRTALLHIKFPESLHNAGLARGHVTRQIIPSEITPAIRDAVTAVLVRHFEKLVSR